MRNQQLVEYVESSHRRYLATIIRRLMWQKTANSLQRAIPRNLYV